jgi:hypothetical protein
MIRLTEEGVLAMNPAREVKTERFSRTDTGLSAQVPGTRCSGNQIAKLSENTEFGCGWLGISFLIT